MKLELHSVLITIALLLCAHYTTDASPIPLNPDAALKRNLPSPFLPPTVKIRKGLPFKNNEMGIVGFDGAYSSDTELSRST
ncbi:hypothetical protein BD408DRAFT_411102 [Parasitella parasitica]|nr:hypothetical protein BD408DRAFT_411102 [Parasitella parasitica]